MQNESPTSRRRFIGNAGATVLALLTAARGTLLAGPAKGGFLFIEAEGFDDHGGWDLDQQSMDQMGSPYLIAHGLGVPVKDATAKVTFPAAGTYRVWVRTRDWVAPWNAPGAPGKFQLIVDGKPLLETFGTKGAEWHWHDGGTVAVGREATLALRDLTGFEGRCEAILFCEDQAFEPTHEVKALTAFRRRLLGLSDTPKDAGTYDLVVVGGGIAGTCAALSAARNGLRVALVQDRPVLGGNGSSEVRVWPEGHIQQEPFPHIGDIVNEILPPRPKTSGSLNATGAENFDDARKLAAVRAEPRITLFLNHRSFATEMQGKRIAAVVIQSSLTGERMRLGGSLFADCTGDATVGFQAGADHQVAEKGKMGSSNLWNLLDASNQADVLKCDCKDKDALTAAYQIGRTEQPFPRCPWALDLADKPFPGRAGLRGQWGGGNPLDNLGGWFWESGFDKDPIEDIERIRDLNLRAMYGAWDALKNVDKLYPNHRLGWSAFITGKRESRRLMGDVLLSADDFRNARPFDDPAYPCSWHIDLHAPDPAFKADHGEDSFISRATEGKGYTYKGPYWAPYRTLYSRNITNLFMAGRNISVTTDGIGPIRVMRTTGMMGETVGKAAALCIRHATTPRGVYEKHLGALKRLMNQAGSTRVT